MPSPIKFVQVANGTPMLISGVGNVSLSPTLTISSVLLALSLSNILLYYLERTRESQFECDCVFQLERKTPNRKEILLWHFQIGYSSFSYLECLFLSCFKIF